MSWWKNSNSFADRNVNERSKDAGIRRQYPDSSCFGQASENLVTRYEETVRFYAPDICFFDAHRHLPTLLHTDEVHHGLDVLAQIARIVGAVDRSLYGKHENAARERMITRDPDDWPIAATAMLYGCGIWTEDKDFFGSGIAIWTTDRVELYLRPSS